jgi:hypothetical protein
VARAIADLFRISLEHQQRARHCSHFVAAFDTGHSNRRIALGDFAHRVRHLIDGSNDPVEHDP